MRKSLAYKILEKNLISGQLVSGNEITIKVNQTLTQDSTGTMVYLQLSAIDPKEIMTDLSVAYVDHNTLQIGFENADDHEFISNCCKKYGIIFSKPGNGICHQLHLENFAKPGDVILGSDSHTPTCGGIGSLAIGAGGLDVAIAMAKGIYTLKMPKIMNVHLTGKLNHGVSSKDIILNILKILSVKGGVNYIVEYSGEGIKNLSANDRATISNMGAELGATTSIFPSDENTLKYFHQNNREYDFKYLSADKNAHYDKKIEINLSEIIPLAACPHSPDNIKEISSLTNIKVDQVAIGSCTNSSYKDLVKVSKILKGKKVNEAVSLVISPGSSKILNQLSEEGYLSSLILSGARILENACGPCIGMGQSPKSSGVSLRTFNRNFKGRCGTNDADVFLCSPETAAISALTGYITDPRKLEKEVFTINEPKKYKDVKGFFVSNEKNINYKFNIGPNIKPFPLKDSLENSLKCTIIMKLGDNISTDDIVPSDAKLLPFRSNIPELSKHCFKKISPDFFEKTSTIKNSLIIAGDNYGQGSSREHAAIVPMNLGIRVIAAKSFARIHRSNLINFGILPLKFKNISDYVNLSEGDSLVLGDLLSINESNRTISAKLSSDKEIYFEHDLTENEIAIIKSGGKLNYYSN